jgi:hypothetical protein
MQTPQQGEASQVAAAPAAAGMTETPQPPLQQRACTHGQQQQQQRAQAWAGQMRMTGWTSWHMRCHTMTGAGGRGE